MDKKLTQRINFHHSTLQVFHWAAYAAIWGYITVILLHAGYDNTFVGTVTGISLMSSILLQSLLSAWVDRYPRLTGRTVALLLSVTELLSAVILWRCLAIPLVVGVCITLLGSALQILPSFVNVMVMDLSLRGVAVNYGLGRGIGSVSYALLIFILGVVLERHSPLCLFPVFFAMALAELAMLYTFRFPLPPLPRESGRDDAVVLSLGGLLRKYPAFSWLLVGCALLQGSHNTLNTYMIHVTQRVGAGEGLMGVLNAIGACMELPSMALFLKMRKRWHLDTLLRVCSVGFIVKCVLFRFAQTALLLYVGSFLQFMELGLFIPCTVAYIAERLDLANQAKGQGLIHICSNGLGPAVISFVCGRLVDRFGILSAQTLLCFTTAVGCAVIWLSTAKRSNREESALC